MDRRVADDDITLGRTSQLHKHIAQTNRTNITSKNGIDKRHSGMLQSNAGVYGVPATG